MAYDSEVDIAERGMILLNGSGDVEFTWDAKNDEKVRAIIEQKMKEGVNFFILKPLIGDVLHRRVKLKKMSELKTHNIKIKDGDIEAMFVAGEVGLVRSGGDVDMQGGKISVKDKDGKPDHAAASRVAVRNRTVGVPALQGG